MYVLCNYVEDVLAHYSFNLYIDSCIIYDSYARCTLTHMHVPHTHAHTQMHACHYMHA